VAYGDDTTTVASAPARAAPCPDTAVLGLAPQRVRAREFPLLVAVRPSREALLGVSASEASQGSSRMEFKKKEWDAEK
jgi:hypothetical protein